MRLLLPALILFTPLFGADEQAAIDGLFRDRAPAIVSVKFVLTTSISMGGENQKQENNAEVRGVMIDPSGLVMLANDHFHGSLPPRLLAMIRRGGGGFESTPSSVKVLFANEAKEFDAVIVARDSTLNLAFVQILDLEKREVSAVDLSKAADTRIGASLLGITRMSRGFDCAPRFGRVLVTGKVEKPRAMWAVASNFDGLGLPVFDAAGAPVGVLASQEASEGVEEEGFGGGAGEGVFLLPLPAIQGSIDQARKLAPEKAKKALSEKEEAPEAPPEGGEKPAEEGAGREPGK
jgi:hypothetical protein